MSRLSFTVYRVVRRISVVVVAVVIVPVVVSSLSLPARAQEPDVAINTSTPKQASPSPSPSPPVSGAVGTKMSWRSGRVPQLLWTGFRANSDGGEVLIQTSAEVELEMRPGTEGRGASFLLKNCRAGRRTDQLPLETMYFNTPVTRVSLRQQAGNLEVAVALRQAVTATPRKEAGPGGSWFWILSFPGTSDTRTTTAVITPQLRPSL